jgi:hypothetical protein
MVVENVLVVESISKMLIEEVLVGRFSSHCILTVNDSTPPLEVLLELLKTKATLLFMT